MSVGKESIKRAASAGTKKSTVKALAEEVKAAAEKPAAPAKKTTRAKTAAPRKTAAKAKTVKTSVLTPANAEELQAKFLSDKAKEKAGGPVHITEELPVYLL